MLMTNIIGTLMLIPALISGILNTLVITLHNSSRTAISLCSFFISRSEFRAFTTLLNTISFITFL